MRPGGAFKPLGSSLHLRPHHDTEGGGASGGAGLLRLVGMAGRDGVAGGEGGGGSSSRHCSYCFYAERKEICGRWKRRGGVEVNRGGDYTRFLFLHTVSTCSSICNVASGFVGRMMRRCDGAAQACASPDET